MLCCGVLCCSDNSDLEAVLKETERQRREFAARYAFMTLDTDGDGYVSVEQVSKGLEEHSHHTKLCLHFKLEQAWILKPAWVQKHLQVQAVSLVAA